MCQVFGESAGGKNCYSKTFIEQKPASMNHHPVKGKLNLANDFELYPHSLAGFYQGTGATVYQKLVRVEEVASG